MTYKHGDWYCKPANEEEAREIIERAVASGAERYEDVGAGAGREYRWNLRSTWGVYNGHTCTSVPENDTDVLNGAAEYTIQQVRELFPLPGECAQWKGPQDGFPPVGMVCEAIYDKAWHRCEILKHKVNDSGMKVAACDFGFMLAWSADFRPIRSERERWVSEAQKHCTEFGSNQLGNLYDALKSGDLKAPE